MTFRRAPLAAAALMASTALLGGAPPPGPPAAQEPAPRRIVAVGDIHGAYDQFLEILQAAGLADAQARWSGGDAVLVQTGDFTDRGVDVREVIDLLMALEEQAPRAGGRVVVLQGNHETMTLTRLLRDASPNVFARFADEDSAERRADAWRDYERLVERRRRELDADPPGLMTEEAWMTAHPPGMLEYLDAFGPGGDYGKWLRRKPAVVEIDGTVFLHGGLNPDRAEPGVDAINRRAREEIERFDDATEQMVDRRLILPFFDFNETLDAAVAEVNHVAERLRSPSAANDVSNDERRLARMLLDLLDIDMWSIVDPDGPYWFRGFATWTPEVGSPLVDLLQERYEATRFVVGHTPLAAHEILPRFDDRVFLIDTGMLTEPYMGQPSELEFVGDAVTAVYRVSRVPLVEGGLAAL
jgi:hypothetical protein